MIELPKRRQNRIHDYDYSTPGAYFITICTAGRENLFWDGNALVPCRGELCSPADVPVSDIGKVIHAEIQKLSCVYDAVTVDTYCIMPDHLHLLITIHGDENGRPQVAPTISRIVKQFKGSITKQLGRSIWQKSFYDHAIRDRQDYDEVWRYIENNPQKYMLRQGGAHHD